MACDVIGEKLGQYVDGELDDADRVAVEKHIASCPDCTATLESYQDIATKLAPVEGASVPHELWPSIESRLKPKTDTAVAQTQHRAQTRQRWLSRHAWAVAASLAIVVSLGALIVSLSGSRVQAAPVDFGKLLDELELDPRQAFRNFVQAYEGKPGSREKAKRHADDLDFELPAGLPNGFQLTDVYLLNFGGTPGVAASNVSVDDFLAVIFHPPVQAEDFGTHEDYECVVGKHRGHKVEVGPWRLVHVTDATTCHCVLSKLDESSELPAILMAVAPRSIPTNTHHDHD